MRAIAPCLLSLLILCAAAPVLAGDGGALFEDDDGDGYCEVSCSDGSLPGDCDDTDPALNLDDVDGDGNDTCAGDCDDTDPDLHARDDDGDGVPLCLDVDEPEAEVPDCDDLDPYTSPLAPEFADGIDNDCDGDIDEDMDAVDDDEDGFSEADGDCNDADALVGPDAAEFCDGIDNDCDNIVDDADDDYTGDDGDGDGDPAELCGGTDCDDADPILNGLDEDEDGSTTCDALFPDCDDNDPDVEYGNEEICGDGLDNDCSGVADDLDFDLDGAVSPDCGGDDCDDENVTINPEAGESGQTCIDQIDNDCDCTGDSNGDGVECGRGDEGVDGEDEDCFAPPEAQAGVDQQDRYLGGVAIIALDGSGTVDDNPDDVLTYTWIVEPAADYAGVTWALVHDPASPYGFLRFEATADSPEVTWVFDCTLVVNDGRADSEDDPEDSHVTATFFRPTFLSRIACATAGDLPAGGALALALALGGLLGLRRRRGPLAA